MGHSPDVVFFRAIPDNDKSNDDRQKEEELLQQIQKLVETRDFLVDDVEFERLRCAFISVIYRWPRLEFFGHFHTWNLSESLKMQSKCICRSHGSRCREKSLIWFFFHLSSLLKIFIMTDKPQIHTSSVVTNADKFFSQFSIQNMHVSTKEFFCSPWKKLNVSSGALLPERVPQSAQQRAISIKDVSGCINELCKGSSWWFKKNKRKKERNRFNEPTDVEMTHSGSSLLISLKQAYHRSK